MAKSTSSTTRGKIQRLKDGGGVALNLEALPSPPTLGFADRCFVLDRGSFFEVSFVYGDPKLDGRVISTIACSVGALLDPLLGASDDFLKAIREALSTAGFSPVAPIVGATPQGAGVPEVVNAFRLTRTGLESDAEFFAVSARDVHLMTSQGVAPLVAPVGLVRMPLPVMVGFLEYFKSLEPELNQRFGRSKK